MLKKFFACVRKIAKSKITEKVGVITLDVCIGFVCFALLLFLISAYAYKTNRTDRPPSALGFRIYNISSGSMDPHINVGDLVLIKSTNAAKLQVGDVITFMASSTSFNAKNSTLFITHRIIQKFSTKTGDIYFTTKGDNNNVADDFLVPAHKVLGKVEIRIPYVGNLLLHKKNVLVSFILLTVLILVVIIITFLSSKRKRKALAMATQ